MPHHRRRVGFLIMKDYDVTKLPFISISREGVKMLKKLDERSLYDVMQSVLDYVLTGEECECEDTLSSVVCGMLIDTIDRKGQKYCNTTKNLKQGNKAETVPVSEKESQPAQKPKPQPKVEQPAPPQPEPTISDDEYFEDFFGDKAMDYSTLVTNVGYFKQRKASDLNQLYLSLGKRYTGTQIIEKLQEKYLERLNR